MLGLIGRKVGMSRLFLEDGVSIPVTFIQVEENRIVQLKTPERDGYLAAQITCGVGKRRETSAERQEKQRKNPDRVNKRKTTVNRPLCGHFDTHHVSAGKLLREFRITEEEQEFLKQRPTLCVDLLEHIEKIDITGISAGKGFAGTIKRWNFHRQPTSHGNSLSHRVLGSTGQNQTPGRVFPGKKMPGHMGHHRVTVKGYQIVKIDKENNLLLVKGAVPGVSGSIVLLKPSYDQCSILAQGKGV